MSLPFSEKRTRVISNHFIHMSLVALLKNCNKVKVKIGILQVWIVRDIRTSRYQTWFVHAINEEIFKHEGGGLVVSCPSMFLANRRYLSHVQVRKLLQMPLYTLFFSQKNMKITLRKYKLIALNASVTKSITTFITSSFQ